MNLSFSGCGFMGIYHVGVAVAFKKYAPHLLVDKIAGASAGALAATALLCNMPLGEMTSDFFRIVNEARSHSLKAFSPNFNIQSCLLEGLDKFLPENAHELVNGRLHISLTRFWGRKNVIVSQFDTREELLQALLCACWIPVFSGFMAPKFRGVRYMDGGFSDNLPVLDEHTVTVSPFCGESDICPRDASAQLFHVNVVNTSIEVSFENMVRIRRILIPPKPEELSNMCQQGFDDALQFLHRNNLINCTRCLAIQSTFVVQEMIHESKDYDPECDECVKHRKDVLIGNHMPETVLTVFQTYIDSANIGLAKWIFRYRGWRLLQTLSLPATVPADLICATLTNIVGDSLERRQLDMWLLANYEYRAPPVQMPTSSHVNHHQLTMCEQFLWHRLLATTPCLRVRFWHLADFIIDQINILNSMVQSQRTQKQANITCQLSLTECGKQKVKAITHRSSKLDILINDNEIVSTIDRLQQQQQNHTSAMPHHAEPALSTAVAADALAEAILHNTSHKHSVVSSTTSESPDHASAHNEALQVQGDVDSFDHILQATSQHEAVYAYYYMDENNKVKVTEIFDMTDNEDADIQTDNERAINQQLQFDSNEWDGRAPDHMFGESTSDHAITADAPKASGRFLGTSEQYSAQRVRRYSAGGRGRNSSTNFSSSIGHHHNEASPLANPTASNHFFNVDDLLIDEDFHSILNTSSAYDPDTSGHFDRTSSFDDSHNSNVTLDDSVSSHSAASSISSPDIMQWLSDDDEDALLAHNFSDPEVDQITSNPSQISDRALRALNRAPQYHSSF